MNFVHENSKMVCEFVAQQLRDELHIPFQGRDLEPCQAIGIEDDKGLIAGCVFNNWRHGDIEVTFAATTPKWATRHNLSHLFDYPFRELGANRVTAFIWKHNKRARRVIEGWGFRNEGLKRGGLYGRDAVMYGLFPREARFWQANGNKSKAK